MRWDLRRILLATFVSWTGIRLTDVALPLITLAHTGSVWATGLVAGCAGVSSLTSPWWGARLRHRLTSGRELALVFGVQAAGHAVVAVGATLGNLTVWHLVVSGLMTGAASALGVPATRAILADIGDRIGPGVAVRSLAWQDFAHRISMVASPPVAAWLVLRHGAMPLMWLDALAVGIAALLVLRVRRHAVRQPGAGSAPRRARDVLREHRLVGDGITMAAVGWFCWFGFALGLAMLGVERGQPGQLIAAGMAGYGIGSLTGSLAASLLVTRLPRVPVMVAGWVVLGGSLMALPALAGSLVALAAASAVGGFAAPLGIAALNALISEQTTGSDRRTAFAVQQVAATGGSSMGMLCGGAVIAVLGAGTTMQVTGLVQVAVPLLLVARRLARSSGWTVRGRRSGAHGVQHPAVPQVANRLEDVPTP